MPAKRLAIVYIRLESIVEILSGGVFQAVRDALPAGAKITGYWMDHSQHDPQLALRLEHDSFRATNEGESVYVIPPPTITALRPPVTHAGATPPLGIFASERFAKRFESPAHPDMENPANWEQREGYRVAAAFLPATTEELIRDVSPALLKECEQATQRQLASMITCHSPTLEGLREIQDRLESAYRGPGEVNPADSRDADGKSWRDREPLA